MSENDVDVVLYEVAEAIATLTFNRPDRLNAWTAGLEARYFELLQRAEADPDVRVIIVTGAGRGWCAGADMDLLQDIGGAPRGGSATAARQRRSAHGVREIRKPIIAAINGACAGIGMAHALFCDLRFAAAGAKFTTAFARRGLIAEHGMSFTLPRLVGTSRALDLLLSGRVVLAEEALGMGLVDRVVPSPELLPATRAYAVDLATNCSPASMAIMKEQVWGDWDRSLDEVMVEADRLMAESFGRPDFKEGVSSFLDKRPPVFPPVT